MLQSLRNRRSRKGFTLAELLIVVAIIAVLVAVAVPLFMGAVKDSKQKVYLANERALRSAAMTKILTDESVYAKKSATDNCWYATGTVDKAGKLSISKIDGSLGTSESVTWNGTAEVPEWKEGMTIILQIKESEINAGS